jgi:hypothetical protein
MLSLATEDLDTSAVWAVEVPIAAFSFSLAPVRQPKAVAA